MLDVVQQLNFWIKLFKKSCSKNTERVNEFAVKSGIKRKRVKNTSSWKSIPFTRQAECENFARVMTQAVLAKKIMITILNFSHNKRDSAVAPSLVINKNKISLHCNYCNLILNLGKNNIGC